MSQECYPFVVDTCCRDFPVCQWSLFLDIYIHFSICCLPGGAVVKNLLANAGDSGSIPGSGKRQPTPVFLPRESHGQRSLADYSPQACRVGHSWAHTHISSAVLGLGCSTWGLQLQHAGSFQLQYVGSRSWPGIELRPPALGAYSLSPGAPGKSLSVIFWLSLW